MCYSIFIDLNETDYIIELMNESFFFFQKKKSIHNIDSVAKKMVKLLMCILYLYSVHAYYVVRDAMIIYWIKDHLMDSVLYVRASERWIDRCSVYLFLPLILHLLRVSVCVR